MARLLPEAQAREQPRDRAVARIAKGYDPVSLLGVKDEIQQRAQRFSSGTASLRRRRQGDADFEGIGLVVETVQREVAKKSARRRFAYSELQPAAGRRQFSVTLSGHQMFGVRHGVVGVPGLVPGHIRVPPVLGEGGDVALRERLDGQSVGREGHGVGRVHGESLTGGFDGGGYVRISPPGVLTSVNAHIRYMSGSSSTTGRSGAGINCFTFQQARAPGRQLAYPQTYAAPRVEADRVPAMKLDDAAGGGSRHPGAFAAVCVMTVSLTLLLFGLSIVPPVMLVPGYAAAYLIIGFCIFGPQGKVPRLRQTMAFLVPGVALLAVALLDLGLWAGGWLLGLPAWEYC